MALVEIVVSMSSTIICGDKGAATTADKLALGELVREMCHIVGGTLTVNWTVVELQQGFFSVAEFLPLVFGLDDTMVHFQLLLQGGARLSLDDMCSFTVFIVVIIFFR